MIGIFWPQGFDVACIVCLHDPDIINYASLCFPVWTPMSAPERVRNPKWDTSLSLMVLTLVFFANVCNLSPTPPSLTPESSPGYWRKKRKMRTVFPTHHLFSNSIWLPSNFFPALIMGTTLRRQLKHSNRRVQCLSLNSTLFTEVFSNFVVFQKSTSLWICLNPTVSNGVYFRIV